MIIDRIRRQAQHFVTPAGPRSVRLADQRDKAAEMQSYSPLFRHHVIGRQAAEDGDLIRCSQAAAVARLHVASARLLGNVP
jgi:hypothetical protein